MSVTSERFKKLLNLPSSPYEIFHSDTKLKLGKKRSGTEKRLVTSAYKAYARMPELILPKFELSPDISLKNALLKRRSGQIFGKKIALKTLSTILYYSCGEYSMENPAFKRRYYPSAGALYPLEIYPVLLNFNKKNGLYHYCVKNHSLERLDGLDKLLKTAFIENWVKKASVIILVTAVFRRNTVKYSNRGYRYIFAEFGAIMQNIYLTAGVHGLSCRAVGGFDDFFLDSYLDVDGIQESIVGVIAIG